MKEREGREGVDGALDTAAHSVARLQRQRSCDLSHTISPASAIERERERAWRRKRRSHTWEKASSSTLRSSMLNLSGRLSEWMNKARSRWFVHTGLFSIWKKINSYSFLQKYSHRSPELIMCPLRWNDSHYGKSHYKLDFRFISSHSTMRVLFFLFAYSTAFEQHWDYLKSSIERTKFSLLNVDKFIEACF